MDTHTHQPIPSIGLQMILIHLAHAFCVVALIALTTVFALADLTGVAIPRCKPKLSTSHLSLVKTAHTSTPRIHGDNDFTPYPTN